MRPVLVSVAVHVAILLALIAHWHPEPQIAPPAQVATRELAPSEVDLLVDIVPSGGGGGGTSSPTAGTAAAPVRAPARARDAWEQVTVRVERASGNGGEGGRPGEGEGSGDGHGTGLGGGIGSGIGDLVRIADDIPAPPAPLPPVKISKARPAKLIYPTRDRDVEDDEDLFVARVTVDADGDVAGSHMVRTRPGARGDQAANAIWEFRYLPALDDDGHPITSTFEQPFQIAH